MLWQVPSLPLQGQEASGAPMAMQCDEFFSSPSSAPTNMQYSISMPSTSALACDVPKTTHVRKSRAQIQREYRLRKKLRAISGPSEVTVETRKVPKSNAQKQREYRERKATKAALMRNMLHSTTMSPHTTVQTTQLGSLKVERERDVLIQSAVSTTTVARYDTSTSLMEKIPSKGVGTQCKEILSSPARTSTYMLCDISKPSASAYTCDILMTTHVAKSRAQIQREYRQRQKLKAMLPNSAIVSVKVKKVKSPAQKQHECRQRKKLKEMLTASYDSTVKAKKVPKLNAQTQQEYMQCIEAKAAFRNATPQSLTMALHPVVQTTQLATLNVERQRDLHMPSTASTIVMQGGGSTSFMEISSTSVAVQHESLSSPASILVNTQYGNSMPSMSAITFDETRTTSVAKSKAHRQREYRQRQKLRAMLSASSDKTVTANSAVKSNAQRQREYRLRKRLKESSDMTVKREKVPKTNAQKQREYRQRKKLKAMLTASSEMTVKKKNVGKSNAQRQREFRLRKSAKASLKTGTLHLTGSSHMALETTQPNKSKFERQGIMLMPSTARRTMATHLNKSMTSTEGEIEPQLLETKHEEQDYGRCQDLSPTVIKVEPGDLESMDSCEYRKGGDADGVETLAEPFFVPVKTEPEFETLSPEASIEENFEETENSEISLPPCASREVDSSEYAVRRENGDGEELLDPLFVPVKSEPDFEIV